VGAIVKPVQLLVGAVVGIYVLFFVVTSPDQAVKITHTAWDIVIHTAHGISTYIGKL
jgi:hypothetical protein